jgi:hypothetical protein
MDAPVLFVVSARFWLFALFQRSLSRIVAPIELGHSYSASPSATELTPGIEVLEGFAEQRMWVFPRRTSQTPRVAPHEQILRISRSDPIIDCSSCLLINPCRCRAGAAG